MPTHQNVPHVLVCALKRAEANRDAEQALALPLCRRNDNDVANLSRFRIVHAHSNLLVLVLLEEIFERIVVLQQQLAVDRHDKVEVRLEASQITG